MLCSRGLLAYHWSMVSTLPGGQTVREPEIRERVRPEPPWNVVLHNDWVNGMGRVVYVLRKVIPGMTVKKAVKAMWTAHTEGKAVVKSCHRELAELYEERLKAKRLTASVEPSD